MSTSWNCLSLHPHHHLLCFAEITGLANTFMWAYFLNYSAPSRWKKKCTYFQSGDNPSGSAKANVCHYIEVFMAQLNLRATLTMMKNPRNRYSGQWLFVYGEVFCPLLPCKALPAGLINTTNRPKSGGLLRSSSYSRLSGTPTICFWVTRGKVSSKHFENKWKEKDNKILSRLLFLRCVSLSGPNGNQSFCLFSPKDAEDNGADTHKRFPSHGCCISLCSQKSFLLRACFCLSSQEKKSQQEKYARHRVKLCSSCFTTLSYSADKIVKLAHPHSFW